MTFPRPPAESSAGTLDPTGAEPDPVCDPLASTVAT